MTVSVQYNGRVDVFNGYLISGWALDSRDVDNKVAVDLIVNNEVVASCIAKDFRKDLKDAGVSDGYSVFDFCPFYWLRRDNNEVRIVYSGTDITIPEGASVLPGNFENIETKLVERLPHKPKISIIMPVYNVEAIWLEKAIESVREQLYENWELCIADDASTRKEIKYILDKYSEQENKRIRVKYLRSNHGVSEASNKAVELSSGEYIAFLDHDDEIVKSALYEIASAINIHQPEIVYSDEIMINMENGNQHLHFKPDFSPDLLLSHNYITHLLCVKKTLFEGVNGFSSKYNGAQDYDLILKLSEKTNKICHIPKLLYIWRRHSSSVSLNTTSMSEAVDAGAGALSDALTRRGIQGNIFKKNTPGFYDTTLALTHSPLVSIIIPDLSDDANFKDIVSSILCNTSYSKIEIIGIYQNKSGNICDKVQLHAGIQLTDKRVSIHECDTSYNLFKKINYGVSLSHGEQIILMRSFIRPRNVNWIETLLEHSQRKGVGAVGAKIYHSNNTICHAGYIIGVYGTAGNSHHYYPKESSGYFHRLVIIQNVSAVASDLLMVKRKIFDKVNGFNADDYKFTLCDVDFCLRILQNGYLNIFTPHCEADQNRIDCRGDKDVKELKNDFDFFKNTWKEILKSGDPYYNPNLSLEREDFTY